MSEVTAGLSSIMATVGTTITIPNLVTVLSVGLGLSVTIFFTYFGARKLLFVIQKALKKGTVHV